AGQSGDHAAARGSRRRPRDRRSGRRRPGHPGRPAGARMSWALLLALAAASYGLKAVGPVLAGSRELRPQARRAVDLVAVPLLAALILVQTLGDRNLVAIDARVPALAVAAILVWRRAPFLVVVLTSAVFSQVGGKGTADRFIDRYGLTGGGAEAVRDVFTPAADTSTSLGVLGVLFLLVAVLSFTRAVQRLFELAWELPPLSVRNTANGLLWAGGVAV